jgi:hypothetical protein
MSTKPDFGHEVPFAVRTLSIASIKLWDLENCSELIVLTCLSTAAEVREFAQSKFLKLAGLASDWADRPSLVAG